MPWQLSDVDSHIKGLSDKRKKVWVAVANGVLAECMKAGGTDETCAPKAIRIANSRAKGANHQEVARMTKDANLSEVGKTISAATAAKLKAAMDAMETAMDEMRGMMPEMDGMESVREPEEVLAEKQMDPNVGGGMDRDKIPDEDFAGKNRSFPIVIPKDVVDAASSIGRASKDNYSTDELKANIIKIAKRKGAKFMAMLPDTWQPAKESATDTELSGEFVALLEATLRNDGTVPIKIIQPGQGSSGWYSPEVLKRDGPKVFTAGMKGYVDHPTESELRDRPERSVKDLALELTTNAHYDTEGSAGPGLYAEAKVYKPWQQFVSDMAPHIGLSIRATGKARDGEIDGKSTKIIEELVSAKSVDLVTVPGAGGKILQLFESARERVETEAAQGRESNKGVSTMTEIEVTGLQSALAEAKAEAANAKAQLAEHEKVAVKRETTDIVAAVFAEAKVSPPDILVAKLTATVPMKEGKVDADAFRAEVKAIAESMKPASASGEVCGMGSGNAGSTDATSAADHAALTESFERRFLNQGKKPDEAKKLAEIAARGR